VFDRFVYLDAYSRPA